MTSLIAYDATGNVIATLDWIVQSDDADEPIGVVDFTSHEVARGEHTDIWQVQGATGSKIWPEYLGGAVYDFRVELAGRPGEKHIAALVHKVSGHRRERVAVEDAIRDAPANDHGEKDLRRIVGGPDRPLILDVDGNTRERPARDAPRLPLLGIRTAGGR